ncbi:branched-chain alpha-keto acid dehydrogenase E2 component [Streptohalobacillus salinus]|uniref:Dihydrolipoamide acetyltransferase component of pyruvate dehydrogenase complex n=1 Tax=Streptohalobacillus salinus TaxID=621096 RepID=A0A2V3WB49_9BACI|nr:dihydrolipoamide acetyltransferase family protein [Streptohalobacillus salinus]PXW91683.1 branched-chain alpha-keto acid dehydrogenase E2 component [Streptohalobacillus salinus]
MIKTITMPQLGESVTEGTISQWLIKKGDVVELYQPLLEVMTDKVNAEVPSSFSGQVETLLVEEGETVAVGTEICTIVVEGEAPTGRDDNNNDATVASETQTEEVDSNASPRLSPVVMRLAQEHQVPLDKVKGTGSGRRITKKDIQAYLSQTEHPVKVESVPTESEPDIAKSKWTKKEKPKPSFTADHEIPVTGIRKAIAENMVRSTTEIPHAWMMIEVDVTNLVNYRNAEKEAFKASEGYNLSYFAFFLNAVAKALKKFPQLNSSWQGDKIVQHKDINLSIAVGNDTELYVPVIKNVDEKSIKGIAKEVHVLAHKARHGQLSKADMEDGTFTMNNTGTFGSVQSMGVINYPQAAILQVESIVKRPVIINDMFAARDMVNLCLSLDHRILDGVICGKFMSHVKEILENISGDTTPIY